MLAFIPHHGLNGLYGKGQTGVDAITFSYRVKYRNETGKIVVD